MSDHTIVVIWIIKTFLVQFFCVFLPLPPLLNHLCFCWILRISILYYVHHCMKYSLDISNFLKEVCSLFYCFPLFVCIIHLRSLSYLSLLFSGTLHSFGCIFLFLPSLSLLFFSQLIVKPPETTTLTFCISCSLGWLWSLSSVQCCKTLSIVIQTLYQI